MPATTNSSMKNILLLSASQSIVGSQQAMISAVGTLIGIVLAPDPALATVPITAMIFGLAAAAGPATFAIYRLGRTRAFMLGIFITLVGGLMAAMAIIVHSFALFCIALALSGVGAAFGQQYRFAAADTVPDDMKGKAISWVLAGGILAAFVGPGLSFWGRHWIAGAEYAGSFLGLSGLAIVGAIILSQTSLTKMAIKDTSKSHRPFLQVIRAPEILSPVVAGMASYGLMTFIMVATPIAMVFVCGHSNDDATSTIQWHIIAMFAPSFVTGSIISRIGARATAGFGLTLILISALILLNGISLLHFNIALVFLGVGWNFGFIGSTTLLAEGYRPEDAMRVQALNEQLVFGTMALASVGSGLMLQLVGWTSIHMLAIPLATIAIATLAWGDWHAKKVRAA